MKYYRTKDNSTLYQWDATTGVLTTVTRHGVAVHTFANADERAEAKVALASLNNVPISADEYEARCIKLRSSRVVGDLEYRKAECDG